MAALTDRLIGHEMGENSGAEDLELFAELIQTGLISVLQSHYGRTAASFIQFGYLTPEGQITDAGREWAGDAF